MAMPGSRRGIRVNGSWIRGAFRCRGSEAYPAPAIRSWTGSGGLTHHIFKGRGLPIPVIALQEVDRPSWIAALRWRVFGP